jgi:hypothetical protein
MRQKRRKKNDERTNRKKIKLLCVVTAAILCWQEALHRSKFVCLKEKKRLKFESIFDLSNSNRRK